MQGPVYGLDTSLTSNEVCGVVNNPMEHGEASKLALYGVADYAWNLADYNAMDSWERGLTELMPQAREAYRTFAIHSCDTENGYRRDESWETRTFRMANWNDDAANALEAEFKKIEQVPAQLEAGCTNQQLLNELRPWLEEFGKLGSRGVRTLELARIHRQGQDDALFWKKYVQNLMTPEERASYAAHKSGTMKLQPFYENAMDDMAHEYLKQLSGSVPTDYKGIGSFSSAATIQTKLMLDNDSTTFYTSGIGQQDGDWIGLDLRSVGPVSEVSILQGRNSKDDVDYFDHAVVEYSIDGKAWTPLTEELNKQYIVRWNGEPVKARYVRLKRLESTRTNYASVRSFEVNPPRVEHLGFSLKSDDVQQALYAFDQQIGTSYRNNGTFSFGVAPRTEGYTLLVNELPEAGNGAPVVHLRQFRPDGSLAVESVIDSSFFKVELAEGVSEVQIEGPVEIFEIVSDFYV